MNWLTNLCVALVVLSPALSQADWPLVRGDALASGVAESSLSAELDVLWKYTLGDGSFEATAILADGKVFVGDFEGTFYALDLATGDLIWKKTFEESGFSQAAAYVDGLLVVCDFNGIVRCLRADNGQEIWSYEATSESYAAPNIHHEKVLLTTEAGEMVALELRTGKRLWQFRIEAPLRCWPTVVEGRVLLAGCDERLHAIDVDTGKETGGLDIDGPTGSTPAALGTDVFFGTEQGTFYSIDTKTMKIRWQHREPKRGQPIRASAAVDRRCVIFGNQGKQVTALKPGDGDPMWTFAVRSRVKSAPVIAGDLVFFATKRGRLYAADIITGEEKWQYQAGGSFIASPAVADEKLLLGNGDGTIYCFGKKKK